MRLLIRLRCTESSKYEMQYHYHLQGFIYNLLRDSKYHYIHNKEGYKFFCFSNIFPVTNNLEKNDLRTLIISSPDNKFVLHLYEMLHRSWNSAVEIKIGHMSFKIDSLDELTLKPPYNSPFSLITGTPILVRIPREKYKMYAYEPIDDYKYIYWRHEHPIVLFLSQVESNLIKKFIQFSKFNDNFDTVTLQDITRLDFETLNLEQAEQKKLKSHIK